MNNRRSLAPTSHKRDYAWQWTDGLTRNSGGQFATVFSSTGVASQNLNSPDFSGRGWTVTGRDRLPQQRRDRIARQARVSHL
jgi:hypothetical protein